MNDPVDEDPREQILWSAVCRGREHVILAEAGDDPSNLGVVDTARGLLQRPLTPGYEFHSPLSRVERLKESFKKTTEVRLRGAKFHLLEHDPDRPTEPLEWVFCAIYDVRSGISERNVKAYLQKLVTLTELWRDRDDWKTGGALVAQATFAPILLQRMQEVTRLGKVAALEEDLHDAKQVMASNIDLLFQREEQLDAMQEETTRLQEMAGVFKKRTKKLRRMKMMQNAKHGVMVGTAITGVTALVVVPPLVAIL